MRRCESTIRSDTNICNLGFGTLKIMGSDTLDGGSGNDEMYGDVKYLEMILKPARGLMLER